MMCCYYPTTTIAIDDDIDFLRVITQHLGIADCISYSSPSKAIHSLQNQKPFSRIQSLISNSSLASDDINTTTEDYAFQINLYKLHEEIYSKDRFHDASVLIIDYYMDEMTGIDVCEALSHHPAKKILLTGCADKEKIAIEAFNKGIIHRFINKSDPTFPTQLKQAVSMLKEAYFRDLTAKLLPNVISANNFVLQHPAYINFTKNLQDQFNIVEYYALDTIGSSISFDVDGKPLWLVTKHESELAKYINIANDQDASTKLINKLTNHEMIPFFFSDEDFEKSVSEWDSYLYPAHSLSGINGCYYAIIEGHIRNNLVREKIISYASHKHGQ